MAVERYHINPATGRPNKCTAAVGNCRYGENASHDSTKEEARKRYEKIMAKELESKPFSKKIIDKDATPMTPYLTYLRSRLENGGEQAKADYSRAVAFSQNKSTKSTSRIDNEIVTEETSMDSYVDYLRKNLQPTSNRHYKVQEAAQAEYSRLIDFARKNKLTSR